MNFYFVVKHKKNFNGKNIFKIKTIIKKGEMHSLFEISQKRPDFDHLSGNDSCEYPSDDEFVLI